MNVPAGITVTAAEFTRQFGKLRHGPDDRPVHITHHGRATHVLIGAARYEAMRRNQPGAADGIGPPDLATFVKWLERGVLVLDRDECVTLANEAALALLDVTDELPGRLLWDAVPALSGSLIERQIRHALASREVTRADLPSPVFEDRWLQLAVHPVAGMTTILLRDITSDIRAERSTDEPTALAAAVAAHPGIGQATLNPRGHIVRAGAVLCGWLGLTEARLRGVAVADLVPTAHKPNVRGVLDDVLSFAGAAWVATEMLTNDAATFAARLAFSELRGPYGQVGAMMVVTRD